MAIKYERIIALLVFTGWIYVSALAGSITQ